MNEPIFLKPTFHERIWGGYKLKRDFGYPIPTNHTGEAWVISAHPHGPSIIMNGELTGKTLLDAWNEYGELFNKTTGKNDDFPLLVKIIDANDDLSVQVHPNDVFSRKVEGAPYGKTECWYILSAEEKAEIILGHHAETLEEFARLVDAGEWEKLLRRVKVKAGDFFYIPSGTIHAIGKGIVILETQQSSDITYRVYDYDRIDADGKKRVLHLPQSKQVTMVPHQDVMVEQTLERYNDLAEKKLVEEKYFTVYHWNLNGSTKRDSDHNFLQVSVVEGGASLKIGDKMYELKKGTHFILPYDIKKYELHGQAEFIVSHV